MKTLRQINDYADYWMLRFLLAFQECFCLQLDENWVKQSRRLHVKLYGELPS